MPTSHIHHLFVSQLADLYAKTLRMGSDVHAATRAVTDRKLRRELIRLMFQASAHAVRLSRLRVSHRFKLPAMKRGRPAAPRVARGVIQNVPIMGEDEAVSAIRTAMERAIRGYGGALIFAARMGLGEETKMLKTSLREMFTAGRRLSRLVSHDVRPVVALSRRSARRAGTSPNRRP